LALQRPVPCRFKILLFLQIFFRSSPRQMGNGPAIVAISRFSGRYAEKCRKTKASNVRSGALRAHSVIIGPGMRCCPSDRPIACLHSLLFHYRSGSMRTELGDRQYGVSQRADQARSPDRPQASFIGDGAVPRRFCIRIRPTIRPTPILSNWPLMKA